MLAVIALFQTGPVPRVRRCGTFAVACVTVAFALHPFVDVANILPGLSRTDNTRLIIVALPAEALLRRMGSRRSAGTWWTAAAQVPSLS